MPALDPFLAEYARNVAAIDNLVGATGSTGIHIAA
jgi:hypothetical protein